MAGPNDSVEASPLPLGRTVVEMPIQGSSGPVKAVNPRDGAPQSQGAVPSPGPSPGWGLWSVGAGEGKGLWVQVGAGVCGCR